jgi:uncharacterized protein
MTTGIVEFVQVFVEGLVKKIVDKPSEVSVQVSSTTKSVLVQIKVEKTDIGKVIGKRGRTIDALKIMTTVVKNTQFLGDKKDIFIEIIEDENSDFYNNRK